MLAHPPTVSRLCINRSLRGFCGDSLPHALCPMPSAPLLRSSSFGGGALLYAPQQTLQCNVSTLCSMPHSRRSATSLRSALCPLPYALCSLPYAQFEIAFTVRKSLPLESRRSHSSSCIICSASRWVLKMGPKKTTYSPVRVSKHPNQKAPACMPLAWSCSTRRNAASNRGRLRLTG
jgi:hypothetical protein